MAEGLRRPFLKEFRGGSLLEDTLPAAMSLVLLMLRTLMEGLSRRSAKPFIHPAIHPLIQF